MRVFLYCSLVLYALGLFLSLAALFFRSKAIPLVSKASLVIGVVIHSIALVLRMRSTGHAPMADMFETLVFYGWTIAVLSVIVIFKYKERLPELLTLPLAIGAMAGGLASQTPGKPLTLILRTRWFETHVISSFVAYAFFSLAFSGAVFYLVCSFRAPASDAVRKFQAIAGRSVLFGFFFFSVSMFSGAVWAYLAWGNYWMWEPKIIWSFIVWFYYAGAMHAYYIKDWRGKALAVATIAGFFVVAFTYLGVSLLMKSSHSF